MNSVNSEAVNGKLTVIPGISKILPVLDVMAVKMGFKYQIHIKNKNTSQEQSSLPTFIMH